jgi:hypothetical protein
LEIKIDEHENDKNSSSEFISAIKFLFQKNWNEKLTIKCHLSNENSRISLFINVFLSFKSGAY